METICLKMEKNIVTDIDSLLKENRYSTRTEFIRDAIRTKLNVLEKEEVFRKLTKFKGSLKGKSKISDEEAGELAFKKIAKKFNLN